MCLNKVIHTFVHRRGRSNSVESRGNKPVDEDVDKMDKSSGRSTACRPNTRRVVHGLEQQRFSINSHVTHITTTFLDFVFISI